MSLPEAPVTTMLGEPAWQWFGKHPKEAHNFGLFMGAQRYGQRTWRDEFRVMRYLEGVDAKDVVFVDVGGNYGHQSAALKNKFPELTGKIVVQDLEAVIEKVDQTAVRESGIELMSHDLFHGTACQGKSTIHSDLPIETVS